MLYVLPLGLILHAVHDPLAQLVHRSDCDFSTRDGGIVENCEVKSGGIDCSRKVQAMYDLCLQGDYDILECW